MNFNKASEHGRKAKPINCTDAHIKVDNLLEYLDRSYFSKQQYESTQRTCIHSKRSCFKVFRMFRQLSNQNY